MIVLNKKWHNNLPISDIVSISPVAGGDVNDAYKVETKTAEYFLLVQPNRSEAFYLSEAAGLEKFAEIGVNAPKVISSGEIDGDAYLLLSFIDEGSGSQADLGHMVAKLHLEHNENGQFGYDFPHEGGDMTFDNAWTDSWIELFVERRLDVIRDLVVERGYWNKDDLDLYDKTRQVIVEALENHNSKPSFLHGDLWAGNYMFERDGTPVLFDPSPFYGDREFDLGATTVFGGFSGDFYDAYDEVYPSEEDAWNRIRFYKFYLIFVHLAKFGGLYKGSCKELMLDIISEA